MSWSEICQARQESVSWPTLSVYKDKQGFNILHTFFFPWLLSLFFTCTSTSQVILPTPSITVHTGRTMTSPVSGNWSFCLHPCSLISCSLHSSHGGFLKMYSISLWLNYFCMLSFLTESKSLLVGGLSTYLLLGLLRLPIFARNALPYCIQKWPTSWGA